MKRIEIIINGEPYPCSPTMGAMVRFKEETGKEVHEADGGFSDQCLWLWCCIVSACRHERKTFDMPFMDFADSITVEDMAKWKAAIQEYSKSDEVETGDGEKKSL